MDRARREGDSIPIQGGQSVQERATFFRWVGLTPDDPNCSCKCAELNPKGLVPAVEYQGKALYESIVLCEFLEDAYPTYKPSLLPSDPYERARVRIWIDHVTKNMLPAWQRLLMAQDEAKAEVERKELYEAQRKYAAQVKGPYFLGEELSLVDVIIAPWAARVYILEEHRGYNKAGGSVEWKEYAERLAARESVLKTASVSSFSLHFSTVLMFS